MLPSSFEMMQSLKNKNKYSQSASRVFQLHEQEWVGLDVLCNLVDPWLTEPWVVVGDMRSEAMVCLSQNPWMGKQTIVT